MQKFKKKFEQLHLVLINNKTKHWIFWTICQLENCENNTIFLVFF